MVLTKDVAGCGKFFEGNAAEMHEALNKRLATLPDDTVVYVSLTCSSEVTRVGIQLTDSTARPRVHKVQCQVCHLRIPG